MQYIERYRNGEYESVWDELQQLGEGIREEPVYSDAAAVARETMVRVRRNILILIERLHQLGFLFGYDHRLKTQFASFRSDYLARLRYLDMFSWVREQPPVFWDANLKHVQASFPDIQRNLALLVQEIGPVALSVSAWYTEVGAVNFYGYLAKWEELAKPLMARCDPLQVRLFDERALASLQKRWQQSNESPVWWEFASSADRKDYFAGDLFSGYRFDIPNKHADVILYEDEEERMTFVRYLRLSLLQYAGFPGMAHWPGKPEEDLELLTQGLIPF